MARLRIYVDTSVIGRYFDVEFTTWPDALMRDFRAKRLVRVPSDVTAEEIAAAPAAVRLLHQELLALSGGVLPVTSAVLTLVVAYGAKDSPEEVRGRHDPHCPRDDRGVDAIVSWNFKHIVRLETIRLFNAVSVELGYRALSILSPR